MRTSRSIGVALKTHLRYDEYHDRFIHGKTMIQDSTARRTIHIELPEGVLAAQILLRAGEMRLAELARAQGCGACCRQLVSVSPAEAWMLVEHLESLPEPRRAAIEARITAIGPGAPLGRATPAQPLPPAPGSRDLRVRMCDLGSPRQGLLYKAIWP